MKTPSLRCFYRRWAVAVLLSAGSALPLFAVNYTLGFGAVEAVYTLDGGPIGGQSPAFAQFFNDPAEAVGNGVGLLLDGSVNISGVSPVAGDIYPVACGTTLPLFTYPFANVVPLYASGTSQPTPQPPHSGTFVMYPATYQDTVPFSGVPVTPGVTDAGCIPYWVNLRHDLTATGRKHIYAKTYRTDPLLPYIAANENPLFPFPATPVDTHTDIELVGAIHLRVFCSTNADGSPRLLNAEANGDFITARIPASPPFTLPVCNPPYRNPQGGLASLTGESGTLRASVSAQSPLGVGGPLEELFLAPAGQSYVVNVEFRTFDLAGPVVGAYTTTSPVVQPGQIVSVDITVDEVFCDEGAACISSIGRVEVLGANIFAWAPDPDPLFYNGPFKNVRHATVTRDSLVSPGGSWEVRSVLPSVPGPGQSWPISPYTPRAVLYFGIPSGYSEVMDMYSTPTNLTCQSPVIDFGKLWVIDPGFVKGKISLDGPACGGPLSCLQLIKTVDALPPQGANFMTESVAFANGPGAVITTIRNISSSATHRKVGYEFWLGGAYQAPSSVWNTGNLLLLLDTPGFPSTLQIRDWLVYNTPLTVQAGQSYTNEHNYWVSEIRMTLVNPGGFEIGNPSATADGYYDDQLNPSQPAFYSVFSTFHGTPVYPNYTTGNASITLCLPQGDYTLTPAVSYRINGTEGSTQFPPFQMKVGRKQCISVEVSTNGVVGPIINLTGLAECTSLTNYVLQGTVLAATNNVITNVSYVLNGGVSVVLCSGAACGAIYNLGGVSIPLIPCANTLTLSAQDNRGLSGSITFTTIAQDTTPPILVGCTNIIITADGTTNGAMVNYNVTAVDICDAQPQVTCVPPPGLFPPGPTVVTCTAVDKCGNTNSCQFTVTVLTGQGDLFVPDTPYNYGGDPDLGREPDPNMTGQNMWLSRGIWVHTNFSQLAGTYLTHQNPRYGQTNCVFVNVTNRGTAPLSGAAKLEVWYANASLSLEWPLGWRPVGTNLLPAINGGDGHIAQFKWSPPGAGHYCLVARIISTADPMFVPETATISSNVRSNNNIAWRNVNVAECLRTPARKAEVRARNRAGTPKPVTFVLTADQGFLQTGGEAALDLGPLFARWLAGGAHGTNVAVTNGTQLRCTGSPARVENIPFDDDEERIFNLTLRANEPMPMPGTNHVYNVGLVQEVDGEAVGGVNYAVVTRAQDTDTDGDGTPDVLDNDDDGDGVLDGVDLAPLGEVDCEPSALTFTRDGDNIVLTWGGLGYRLQSTPALGQAWTEVVGGTSPAVLPPTTVQQFFRLICP